MGEWMYRSTFSWTRQYLEVSGQLHAPAALLPGKRPRYPFYKRLIGPQSRSGRYGEVKIFTLPGLELRPPVVQSVASRYTDWAILAPLQRVYFVKSQLSVKQAPYWAEVAQKFKVAESFNLD
jgi:hypothetical protein